MNITNNLPETYGMDMYSLTDYNKRYNKIGPTGNNVWCYADLGKRISEDNSGMPVAFFNAASSGSTITTWYQGAQGNVFTPNGYVGGNQFCVGYMGGSSNPVDYYGQPYTPLKTSLNYHASIFGVRGVLWHQGEGDNDSRIPTYAASSATDYQTKLQYVISKSRSDFNNSNLTWFVSKATFNEYGPVNAVIRNGQKAVISSGAGNNGPDTDYVTVEYGTVAGNSYRRDMTHFEESYNSALSWLSGKWRDAIGSSGNKISGGFVPVILFSQSGSTKTYTAPTGAGYTYRWGTSINSPIPGATSNVFSTTNYYSGLRCFVKDGSGNWHPSAAILVNGGGSSRLAAEAEKQPGELVDEMLQFSVYPNPSAGDVTVQFSVSEPNSDVRLEIIDQSGKIVKVITDNPHAVGVWKYPVSGLNLTANQIYYCRLKVKQVSTVKKLIKVH